MASAVVASYLLAVAIVVVLLPREIAASPEILVGPLETAAVIAYGVAIPGHPKSAASPSACSVPSPSSFVEFVGVEFVGSSTDALSNDGPGSHSSNLVVSFYKRTGPFDSRPNLRYSLVSDTSGLPKDATTTHCRKRCPRLRQGRRRHTSQAALLIPAVRQI